MITSASPLQPSNFRQLSDLLSAASAGKFSNEPFLRRSATPLQLLRHIEKELPVNPAPAIFRRLGKHTQLCMQFS